MPIAPFLTTGLGNGSFAGNIPQFLLTGLSPGIAAARALEDGAAWLVVAEAIPNKGVR